MPTDLHIDGLDRKILGLLTANARLPFMEIARKCKVSGAAIHQRVKSMWDAGIFNGSQYILEPKALGYETCAFIGIQVHLLTTKSHQEVFSKISRIPEIVECHHISGKYSLLIKVYAKDNEHLKNLIIEKIQSIPEVTFTETFISLQEGFIRQIPVE
ncbi:MAG: Lrp/AsnC ligand binding domain-containing protein [Bacteroidota bacterium]